MSTIHVAAYLKEELREWIRQYWYCDRQTDQRVVKESWGSDYLVVWAMATSTEGLRKDGLSVSSSESMGVQFIRRAIDASMKLHQYRYTHREVFFRRKYPRLATIRQWLHTLLESKRKGGNEEENDLGAEQEETASAGDSDTAGWTTDEGEEEWDACFQEDAVQDPAEELSDEEVEWPQCDDIQVE